MSISEPLSEQMDLEWNEAVKLFKQGDLSSSLKLFKRIEEKGSLAALVEIGNIYELGGEGVQKDFITARYWYERAYNEANSKRAILALGRIYYIGNGVERDHKKAFEYFSLLKDQDEAGAHFILGVMNQFAQGTELNVEEAYRHYKTASKLGHVLSQKHLARMMLSRKCYIKGTLLLIKSTLHIFLIAIKNPTDRRLTVN